MATHDRPFDDFRAIVDSIMLNPDPVYRVVTTHSLLKEARRTLSDARGEAIYRLLEHHNQADAMRLTGIDRATLSVYAGRWRAKRGQPKLRRGKRINLSNGIDLSGEPPQSLSSDDG